MAMIPQEFQLTTLPYVLACAAVTSLALRRKTPSRLNAAVAAIVVLLLVKMAIESRLKPPNFYELLGVHKASTVMQVHLAFKAIMSSFGLHSNLPPEFVQDARRIYEVLMESETRDVYNRFGLPGLSANVHADELQLIMHIAVPYILWLGVVLLMTTDAASRGCRPWIATAGIAVLIIDASLCTTQLSLPVDLPWLFPPAMTEYELRWKLHSVFGAVCMVLRAFAIYRYFDAPGYCAEIVSLVHVQNETVGKALQQIRAMAASPDADAAAADATGQSEEELAKIKSTVERSWQGINTLATAVHTHVNRPRHNYYWILFGLLYVGVYLLGA